MRDRNRSTVKIIFIEFFGDVIDEIHLQIMLGIGRWSGISGIGKTTPHPHEY
jgi:hypothetical protein